jgi:hypothetical protein
MAKKLLIQKKDINRRNYLGGSFSEKVKWCGDDDDDDDIMINITI